MKIINTFELLFKLFLLDLLDNFLNMKYISVKFNCI